MSASEIEVQCPFCGEAITIVVDCAPVELGPQEQTYTEDCSVCCRPILFRVRCDEGEVASVDTDRSGI